MPNLDELIRLTNPWWRNPRTIEEDRHLISFQNSSFHWDPPPLGSLDLETAGVHTIRGPRQVGKTTTLKRLIRALLDRGEERILYYALDLESDPGRIVDVLHRARDIHHDPDGKWYIFLDEVTQIKGWQQGVKYAWDQGLIRDDLIVLSGSSARDLVEGTELLPGRRGGGDDFVQMPVSFRSFARSVYQIDLDLPPGSPRDLLSEEGHKRIKRAALSLEELNRAFGAYLRCGGFPAAVRDWIADHQVSERTLKAIWDAIGGDVSKAGLERVAALKLLDRITISLGSGFSWTSAAGAMDKVPNTAKSYVNFLTLAFVLLPVHFWDLGGKGFNPSKERKIYFIDPVLSQIPVAAGANTRGASEEALVESVVASSLFRSLPFRLLETFPLPHAIGYWKAKSRREIDFLANPQRDLVPLE